MINNEYDVIVIGAGIAGIGASQVLTAHKICHLILQSRNRIGGRILQGSFQGARIQLGASFVHSPNSTTHLIHQFIQNNKKEVIPAQYHKETYYYQNQGTLPEQIIQKGQEIYEKFQLYAGEISRKLEHNNMLQVFQQFEKLELVDLDQNIKNLVRWKAQIFANIEGAELHELSLDEFVDAQCESSADYLPAQGYSSIVQEIFSKCQPELLLQQAVTEIDYQGQLVVVKTNKGSLFYCRQLISSLPLGVLQQEKVKFSPSLPKQYINAIKDIGNGVANKIFVSFDKPFWREDTRWLNFVTKTAKNRYPVAAVQPSQTDNHIICVFISGQASIQVSKWSEEEVKRDFTEFISAFLQEQIKITGLFLTRWHLDENSLGSYSYGKIGQKFQQNIGVLSVPIQSKIWFIGEYMNKQINSCVHSAYQTGVQTGQKVTAVLQQPKQKP